MTPHPTVPTVLHPDTFAQEMDDFLGWMATAADEIDAAGNVFGLSVASSSVTSLAIGPGAKSLVVQTGKGYAPGMDVAIAYRTTPSTRMAGTVTSYDSATGALVVNVASVSGAGTYANWSIVITSMVSFDGQVFSNLILSGKITEGVYALAGTDINPANGSIQTKTLTASTTFTESLANGNSVVLILTSAGYSVVWPAIVWLWGSAPSLSPTGKSHIVLYQIAGVLYGVLAGTSA